MIVYFVLLSTCTKFYQKQNLGGVSETKINEFILCFSQLALNFVENRI
jgi:hypothetical protein